MKIHIKIISILLLATTCTYLQTNSFNQIPQPVFELKEIHNTLFDLYLPEDGQLSTTEKKKRLEWREQLWLFLQTKPEIMGLLNLLQPSSPILPDDIKREFGDIVLGEKCHNNHARITQLQHALRNHPDNNVRKFTETLRKIYSYLTYSGPLTSKISGYQNASIVRQANSPHNYALPKTKLQLKNNIITHTYGDIDYLIVGSGPAGSIIAYELARQKPNSKVVLIDSGSLVIPHSIVTESVSEFMEAQNNRTTIDGGIALRNGRAFGGGTIANLDLAFSPLLPQIKNQIRLWIDADSIDASFVHTDNGIHDWKKLSNAYEYIKKHVGTRLVSPEEINENNKILLNGTPTATTYNLNARKPGNHNKNLKISALEAFILPAMTHGLSIIPDATVKKIIFDSQDSTHASGVQIEFQNPLNQPYTITDPNHFNVAPGTKVELRAKNIIVCAGTLGSAEVLLRSNIPNNNIGKGIVIHPSMGMYGRFEHEVDVLHGLSASVYAPALDSNDGYFFESMSADPVFIALINFGSGKQVLDIVRDVKYLGGFGIMLIDSVNPENKVFIDPATDTVQVQYTLGENDKKRFRKGLTQGLTMLFEQGAYEVHLPSSEQLFSNNENYSPCTFKEEIKKAIDQLQFRENQNFISSAHMQGSNKIGSNPKTSVVSKNFKVWNQSNNQEIDNLYVCDSSIFPTSVGANPMQSIYTFAKLFIDQHIEEISSSTYSKIAGYLSNTYNRIFKR